MAIQNDFTIYPKTKVIRHTSGTTTYTAVAFYSWLMTTFDEPGYLTYQTPIKFNTPTSFTMTNGWFLDNGDGSEILKFIYGGGIDTSGYATVSDPIYMLDLDDDSVVGGYADFVSTDKDKNAEDDDVVVGPLLTYKNNYPAASTSRIWVRDTRTTPANIADNSKIDLSVAGGTGRAKVNGTFTAGDEIYLNLFTINSFPGTPQPQIYIYQKHPSTQSTARIRIVEWSHLSNWDRDAATAPTTALLDVLFPIKLGGALIDSGNFKTFVRQTGDTCTFVESTIVDAGRTPIAVETAADTVNVTKGEHYMFYTSASNPAYTAGQIIQDVATGGAAPPSWYAEVVAHTNWAAGSGYITIRSLRGAPANGNAIYVGATQLGTAVVSGTVGDTYITYGSETTGPVSGDIGKLVAGLTSTAERVLRAYQDDGTTGKLLLQVYHTHGAIDGRTYTGTTRDFLYKDFSSGEVIDNTTGGGSLLNVTTNSVSTTLISGYSDITIAHINGNVTVNTFGGGNGGIFILGERVTWTGGGPAIVVDSTTTTLTLANVVSEAALTTSGLTITGDVSGATCLTNGTGGLVDNNTEDYAFTLQSAFNYSVFIEGGSIYNTGRSLSDIYMYLQYYVRDGQNSTAQTIYTSDDTAIIPVAAEEYIRSVSTYSASKTAPFGTLAGTTFFGAQGVWIQGMISTAANNIKLIDHGGTLRQPDPSINLVVSNLQEGDRVAVYLKHATQSIPDKAQFTSHNTANVQSDSTFERDATSFPIDTPSSGSFIAVDTSANEEHRYRYLSWATTVLTLPVEKTGSATTDTDSQVLISTDTSPSNFTTGGTSAVQIGDIVRRSNNEGGWAYVTSVDSATQITTTLLSTPGQPNWDGTATADTYEINSLVVTYDNTDKFFIPYMDFRALAGDSTVPTKTVTVLYSQDRNVFFQARNVENSTQIIPFTTTGTISSTGFTQSIIRNEDTVYA